MKKLSSSANNEFTDIFFQFSDNIKSKILSSNNADAALRWAQIYGDILFQNHSGVYSCEEIESFIVNIVIRDKSFIPPKFSKKGGTVLLATKLYDMGGHTAVALSWLKAFQTYNDHRLVVTSSIQDKTLKQLNDNKLPYYICTGNGVSLINEICHVIGNADRIVLLIHPFDILSTSVARILSKIGKDVIFYNHADHVFSYGVQSSSIVCEVSTFGITVNNRTGRVNHSYYLGIPLDFDEKVVCSDTRENMLQTKTILSCGASYKYEPKEVSFADFIDQILEKNSNIVIYMVGSSGTEPWWNGYINKWGDKVRFFGLISQDDFLNLLNMSAVYVDSFPITGGSAFPLALVHGCACTGLKIPIQGYSDIDYLRVNSISELVDQVINILNGDSACLNKIEKIRKKVELFNKLSSFQSRVKNIYAKNDYSEKMPNVPVDSYWFEKRWKNNKKIILPSYCNVYALNVKELFFLLLELNSIRKYVETKELLDFFYCHLIKGIIKRFFILFKLKG